MFAPRPSSALPASSSRSTTLASLLTCKLRFLRACRHLAHTPHLSSHTNKKICDEVAIIPSKRLRNKIAGFTTHLMKRIQKGPVRGISFKLQEEERERKDNFGELGASTRARVQRCSTGSALNLDLSGIVPEVSALDTQGAPLDVDPDTKVSRRPPGVGSS